MMLTAVQAFYNAVDEGKLPGSIPVKHPDGTDGLLTGSAAVDEGIIPEAYNENPLLRACVAIHICNLTVEAAQTSTILRPVS